jgi:hypothetical protein
MGEGSAYGSAAIVLFGIAALVPRYRPPARVTAGAAVCDLAESEDPALQKP